MTTLRYLADYDLRNWLRIPDNADDDVLALVAAEAEARVDDWCGWSFHDTGSATARTFHASSREWAMIDPFHTTTGLVVKTDDDNDGTFETTWTYGTDYTLEPANGIRNGVSGFPYFELRACGTYRFPIRPDRARRQLQVTARWGWAAVPDVVPLACRLEAARVHERRNTRDGVIGEAGMRAPAGLDADAAQYLWRLRAPWARKVAG